MRVQTLLACVCVCVSVCRCACVRPPPRCVHCQYQVDAATPFAAMNHVAIRF
jgi:hypothetical protein